MKQYNRGKQRADPRLSQIQEGTSHDLSGYRSYYQEYPTSYQQQPIQEASTSSMVQYPHRNSFLDQPYGSFLESPGQHQLSSWPNDYSPAYYTPDNQLATALDKMGRGEGREDPWLSPIQAGPSSDLSVYQPHYQPHQREDPLNSIQHRQHASTSSLEQYPPSNAYLSNITPYPMPREGHSAGFFEGSNGIEINGGKFNQTYGHHTNVTIHVNQPREDAMPMPMQYPLRPPVSPSFRAAHPNPASLPPQNILYDQFSSRAMSEQLPSTSTRNIAPSPIQHSRRSPLPSMSTSEQGPSTSIHNIVSSPIQDIRRGQLPSTSTYEQGRSTSTTIYAPENSNKTYERHLGLTQRGFPLWIPEPNRNLPMPYRRKGINIGDVGIITPTGGFSFLFNICLPPDHPINPRTLPEGFAPIYPPIEPMDFRQYSEFKPESYLASTAIEKVHNDPPFPGLSFVTSAAEGAVLTLPDGAISRDLENTPRFRAYAAANIENWYRYINGPRGREAKNGEVRLVIGCDKATSWGMAVTTNMTQDKTHYLKYRSVNHGRSTPAPIPLYKWEYTGLAQARVGPDLPEIEDLKRNDDSDDAVDGKYWNQCLFIRTLNLTLNHNTFAQISQELELAQIQEEQHYRNRGGPRNLAGNTQNAGTQEGGSGMQSGMSSGAQTRSTSVPLGFAMDRMAMGDVVKGHVTMSRSPSAPNSHPSDVLNQLLLQKVPNSRLVVTQDEDWCSVIKHDDEVMPNPSEIAARVLAAHRIREDNGIVFLEPKKKRRSWALRYPISNARKASSWLHPTIAFLDDAPSNQAGLLLLSQAHNQLQTNLVQATPSVSRSYSPVTPPSPIPLDFLSPFDLPSPSTAPTSPPFPKPRRASKQVHFPVGKGLTEVIYEDDGREPPLKPTIAADKGKGRKGETAKQSPIGLTEDIHKHDEHEMPVKPVKPAIAAEKGNGGKGEPAKRGSRLKKSVHFNAAHGELDEEERWQ